MLEGVEADGVCRDEWCPIVELHMANDDRHGDREKRDEIKPRPHHRPRAKAPLAPKPLHPNYVPWKQADTQGLLNSVMKATNGRVPVWFQEIRDEVRDDYGDVADRTVWRAIKKLVERGALIKLDIGLAFAAYIRPIGKKGRKAGRLDDINEMREYMLGLVECHPTGRDS